MKLRDVVQVLEDIAPLRLAEAWDNVGLLAGDPDDDVHGVLCAVDLTAAVLEEAGREGCDLVLAYHPLVFKPLPRVTAGVAGAPGSLVYAALRRGIAVYSPHTALDAAAGGTNDVLADVLRLVDRVPLRPVGEAPSRTTLGMGRAGTLATPLPRSALFDEIKAALGCAHLLVAGPTDGIVRRAAVGAGSGGDLLDDALAQHADLYLTGELRHHDALRAAARGMTVVCALHSNSERVTLRRLVPRLEQQLAGVPVRMSRADHDPFHVV